MMQYVIEGGKKLEGEISISGSKNAALPILAGCILNAGRTELFNVPNINDTQITLEILEVLGCKVTKKSDRIIINSKNINCFEIPEELMRKLRSSVVLAGALIGRFKNAIFSYPGGCDIGSRPIDLHLNGFRKLGINIEENSGYLRCMCDKIVGNTIHLDFPSVGATENIILASVLGEGETIIENSALEPEIVDLQNFLNQMGAKIEGAGTNIIKITGVKKLKSVSYKIIPDRIEAGTFLAAAAITGGNIKINDVIPEHISPILHKFDECKCKLYIEKKSIILESPKRLSATQVKTLPYPGFPTDMQAIFSSMLTVAKGTSVITENIFENRFKYMNELKRMGAKITIEGKTAIIKGVKRLSGATTVVTDLRGGAAMVLAALNAKGTSKVEKIEYIMRGYESFEGKLRRLGASITKEEVE